MEDKHFLRVMEENQEIHIHTMVNLRKHNLPEWRGHVTELLFIQKEIQR
jgi:hypothetical protein